MNKIINGVASEYDMPMKCENKSTTIFIDTQDMEERYGEQLYQEYLEKENQQLKEKVEQLEEDKEIEERIEKLGEELNKHFQLMVEAKKYFFPEIHEDLLGKKIKR